MQTFFDLITEHHDKVLYCLAAISLIIELTLIGLSGPLLFFSVGCLITGILVSLQVISGLEIEILSVGLFSLISAVLLWKPLKKIQGDGQTQDDSSDLIGQVVIASETISAHAGAVRHSGINWTARLDNNDAQEIESQSRVIITAVNGNILLVKKA